MYRYSEGDFYLVYTSLCVILKFYLLTISIVKKIYDFLSSSGWISTWFLVSFEGSRYSYQLTLMLWLNNGPISNIFRRKCKIKPRACQRFFFTTNSLQHVFFPGIAWSRSSDSFEVKRCILVTLIFFLIFCQNYR